MIPLATACLPLSSRWIAQMPCSLPSFAPPMARHAGVALWRGPLPDPRSALELAHLLEQLEEIIVADLVLQRRDQRLGFLDAVGAQRAQGGALELRQLRVAGEQALDRLDVLLLLEARERVKVVDRLGQNTGSGLARASVSPAACAVGWRSGRRQTNARRGMGAVHAGCVLGIVDVLPVIPPLGHQCVDD